MIKLLICDLDGVLIDIKDLHAKAFNMALENLGVNYNISHEDHLQNFDGLPSKVKLQKLVKLNVIEPHQVNDINNLKQSFTRHFLDEVVVSDHIQKVIEQIPTEMILAVCSNSVTATIYKCLEKLGILDRVNMIFGADECGNSKPHPEMYWNAMSEYGFYPEETLIIEDSPNGLSAAYKSGAHVLRVENSEDLTFDKLSGAIDKANNKLAATPVWNNPKLNIVIPLAGEGSRFASAGYTFPKPLVEVDGKPMIQRVIENIGVEGQFTFLIRQEHLEKFSIDKLLRNLKPDCNIVVVNETTEGAACTALLAANYIDNDQPLFFANSDQLVEWNSLNFFYAAESSQCDAIIPLFKAVHPKWSFAELVGDKVVRVAEKNPISDNATVGFYYWKHGSDFCKYATWMISNNVRVNNEFYICPVFNEAIADGKQIGYSFVDKMYGLGTPEDLNTYLATPNRPTAQ